MAIQVLFLSGKQTMKIPRKPMILLVRIVRRTAAVNRNFCCNKIHILRYNKTANILSRYSVISAI